MGEQFPHVARRRENIILTLLLFYDISPSGVSGKGGPVSRACPHCQKHAQRLRSVSRALTDPGSRKQAPWVLWPRRGSPQYSHTRRPGSNALECRRPWSWRVQALQAKTAAFFSKEATARLSPAPKSAGSVRGGLALRRTPSSQLPFPSMLAWSRDENSPSTFPAPSPSAVKSFTPPCVRGSRPSLPSAPRHDPVPRCR